MARCYLKCYLPPALPVFSQGLLHSQTRRLQAIAGLPQGYEGTERNHNPRVGEHLGWQRRACFCAEDDFGVSDPLISTGTTGDTFLFDQTP